MIISVISFSTLKDEDVQQALRSINRQIQDDFRPYWSLSATLRLEGKGEVQPEIETSTDMRGEAVLRHMKLMA